MTTVTTRRPPSSVALTLLFLGLGAAAFLVDRCVARDDGGTVEITEGDVTRLIELWRSQARRPPTGAELEALVEQQVREEILVREAQRLGLDRDDTIIRRRLAQKMTFLLEDTSETPLPPERELRSFFEEHRDEFARPRRTSFRHVFLDAGTDSGRAGELLGELRRGARWRQVGDPFMLQREMADRTDGEIDRVFGAGFAERLADVEVGVWSGPLDSVLGRHLVLVRERRQRLPATWEEARNRVAERVLEERRRQDDEEAFAAIAERYRVRRPDPSTVEDLLTTAAAGAESVAPDDRRGGGEP